MSNIEYTTIADIVRRWADETPDAPCLSQGMETLTWSDVYDRSARVAAGLCEAGVRPGDRVAYLAKNDVAFFMMCFGAAMCGAVIAPVNFRLAPREMLELLDFSGAKVLLIGADFLDHLEVIEDELSTVTKIVVLGESSAGHESFEEWISRQEPHDPQVSLGNEETVAMMFTSGTTGLPKGVMINNEVMSALFTVSTVSDDLNIRHESVLMSALPIFHGSGFYWVIPGLALGCHCVVMNDLSPGAIVDAIERYRITKTILVATVMQSLLSMPDLEKRDLTSLETMVYAGAPMSPSVLARCIEAFRCDFVQIYGLTETAGATILTASDHRNSEHVDRLSSVGRARAYVIVKIVDPATGLELPEGQVGEVWVKAPTNSHGYWKDPARTAEALTEAGYFKTGDGGTLVDGYLYLRDRIKDMIVTGGENVYPIEVENVLMAHPGIVDVAVIAVPSEKWGESVKAVVVAAPGTTLDPSEVIAWARKDLAAYKCPTSVDVVDQLPRNPSGKVSKKDLRASYWSNQGSPGHPK